MKVGNRNVYLWSIWYYQDKIFEVSGLSSDGLNLLTKLYVDNIEYSGYLNVTWEQFAKSAKYIGELYDY